MVLRGAAVAFASFKSRISSGGSSNAAIECVGVSAAAQLLEPLAPWKFRSPNPGCLAPNGAVALALGRLTAVLGREIKTTAQTCLNPLGRTSCARPHSVDQLL